MASAGPDFILDEAAGARTQTGQTLLELSRRGPVLVLFLRHSACTFCRQALADLAARRDAITAAGAQIVLVHMQSDAEAARLFARYGLDDAGRISDPERKLYQAFQLPRGTLAQVAGPGVWGAGLKSLLSGHAPGIPSADVWQLPGAFLIKDGKIVRGFRAATSADRPDYAELVACPIEKAG